MTPPLAYIDTRERFDEKEQIRRADARAVVVGQKSVAQLKRENEAFAFAPQKTRLKLSSAKALH